jgi:hypothetical protein
MPRRELLTDHQRAALTDPATDERTMVRFYTLTAENRELLDRRRGDPNRLGFAVLLCYLRFPGRTLTEGERLPARAQLTERVESDGQGLDNRTILNNAGPSNCARFPTTVNQKRHGLEAWTVSNVSRVITHRPLICSANTRSQCSWVRSVVLEFFGCLRHDSCPQPTAKVPSCCTPS